MVFMNITVGAIAGKIWTFPGLSGSVRYSNGIIVTAKSQSSWALALPAHVASLASKLHLSLLGLSRLPLLPAPMPGCQLLPVTVFLFRPDLWSTSSLGFACSPSSLEVADYLPSSFSLHQSQGTSSPRMCVLQGGACRAGWPDCLHGTSPHLNVSALYRGFAVKPSWNSNNGARSS